MEQLILNVKDKGKLPFLIQLLKHMKFVEVMQPETTSTIKKKQVLNQIDDSVEFIKKYNKGEVKAKSFKQLLDEL